jgi:hypothetical protein
MLTRTTFIAVLLYAQVIVANAYRNAIVIDVLKEKSYVLQIENNIAVEIAVIKGP